MVQSTPSPSIRPHPQYTDTPLSGQLKALPFDTGEILFFTQWVQLQGLKELQKPEGFSPKAKSHGLSPNDQSCCWCWRLDCLSIGTWTGGVPLLL